jgi:cyclopropane fatty-acyl-phospholipid synthase-like methyltransferase
MKLNIYHNENTNGLPAHLGGHQMETHVDEGALQLLIDKFGVQSYLDVGCGPGGMVDLAESKGLTVLGVDGDYTLERAKPENFVLHDYTKGPAPVGKPIGYDNWDLGWSCEFLEHVEERYMDNYMDTFLKCKRIVVTHAFPGQGGHHHVNEKDPNYWFQQFGQRGFLLDMKTTDEVRRASTMTQRYIRVSGMVFFNSNLDWKVA